MEPSEPSYTSPRPPWYVGRTDNFDAAVSAITHMDAAVGTVYDAFQAAGYVLLVTADHGNAEQMRNADTGAPHTAHTCNPVPFIVAGPASEGYALVPDDERAEEGALCDVSSTVLDLLGIPKPEEMTGDRCSPRRSDMRAERARCTDNIV
ncbi:alkaline-phosphatase-like protein [Mycena latifolia]|nr:alkaline-phosphatase-like protein [Mycena latifolia]